MHKALCDAVGFSQSENSTRIMPPSERDIGKVRLIQPSIPRRSSFETAEQHPDGQALSTPTVDVDACPSRARLSELSDKAIDAIIDWADSRQGNVKITGRSQNPSNDSMECQERREHSRRHKSDHGSQQSRSTNLSDDHSLTSIEMNRSRNYSCRQGGHAGLGYLKNSSFESSTTSSHSRSSGRSSNPRSAVKSVAFVSCESFNTGRDTKRRSNRTSSRSRRVPSSSDSVYSSYSSMVSSLTSVSSSLRRLTSDHGSRSFYISILVMFAIAMMASIMSNHHQVEIYYYDKHGGRLREASDDISWDRRGVYEQGTYEQGDHLNHQIVVPLHEPLSDLDGDRNGHFDGLMEESEGNKRTAESAKYLRAGRIDEYRSERQRSRGADHHLLDDASRDFQRSRRVGAQYNQAGNVRYTDGVGHSEAWDSPIIDFKSDDGTGDAKNLTVSEDHKHDDSERPSR